MHFPSLFEGLGCSQSSLSLQIQLDQSSSSLAKITTKPQKAQISSLILKDKSSKFYLYSVHSLVKNIYLKIEKPSMF